MSPCRDGSRRVRFGFAMNWTRLTLQFLRPMLDPSRNGSTRHGYGSTRSLFSANVAINIHIYNIHVGRDGDVNKKSETPRIGADWVGARLNKTHFHPQFHAHFFFPMDTISSFCRNWCHFISSELGTATGRILGGFLIFCLHSIPASGRGGSGWRKFELN